MTSDHPRDQAHRNIGELLDGLRDPESGLVSGTLFRDRLQRAVLLARRESLTVAVVVIEPVAPAGEGAAPSEATGPADRATLGRIGTALEEELRISDTAALLAKRTIGVILPNVNLDSLPQVLQRIRQRADGVLADGGEVAAIGMGILGDQSPSADAIVEAAFAQLQERRERLAGSGRPGG